MIERFPSGERNKYLNRQPYIYPPDGGVGRVENQICSLFCITVVEEMDGVVWWWSTDGCGCGCGVVDREYLPVGVVRGGVLYLWGGDLD